MTEAERDAAIQQTRSLIMFELGASGPRDYVELEAWLIEQCSFDATYLDDALDILLGNGRIVYDQEDDTYDIAE